MTPFCQRLRAALQLDTKLVYLGLRCNGLKRESTAAMRDLLREHTALEIVDLRDNRDPAVRAFFIPLSTLSCLMTFSAGNIKH
jgi:hypothetical protein